MDLSLVLACYNEEPLLADSVRKIVEVLDGIHCSYELIFVDDASTDTTRQLITELAVTYQQRAAIHTIFHEQNVGRGGTVCEGLRIARGDVIGYVDIDLEIAAHYILPCLLAIRQGSDVAIGKRVYKFKWRSLDRFIISKGYAWLIHRLLNLDGITDTETGYKFFKRDRVLPLLAQCREAGWFWDTEIMALCHRAGLSIREIPCLLLRRFDKQSSVQPLRDSVDCLVKLMQFRTRMRAEARRR